MLTKQFNGVTYKLLPYNILYQSIVANGDLTINEYCNSWTILNQGNEIITVNNAWKIYPGTIGTNNGESESTGGNYLEVFKGVVTIAFAGGGIPLAVFAQKIYLFNYTGS